MKKKKKKQQQQQNKQCKTTTTKKKQKQKETTTTTTTNHCQQSLKSYSKRKECSQNPGKILKTPQGYSFSSQAADYKSETQLKTRPPTDILQKSHPDPGLYLQVLEIHEHLFFKKLALNGYFLKKKKNKKNKTKKTKTKKEQQQQ